MMKLVEPPPPANTFTLRPLSRFTVEALARIRPPLLQLIVDAFTELDKPRLQAVLAILESAAFRDAVNLLPGYAALRCGQVDTLQKAFPLYAGAKRLKARRVVVG